MSSISVTVPKRWKALLDSPEGCEPNVKESVEKKENGITVLLELETSPEGMPYLYVTASKGQGRHQQDAGPDEPQTELQDEYDLAFEDGQEQTVVVALA